MMKQSGVDRSATLKELEGELSSVDSDYAVVASSVSDILDRIASDDRIAIMTELSAVALNVLCAVLPRRIARRFPAPLGDADCLLLQSGDDTRMKKILEPISAEMERRGYSTKRYVVGGAKAEQVLPGIGIRDLAYANTPKWRREIPSVMNYWLTILLRYRRSGKISSQECILLLRWLLIQSRRLDHAEQILSGTRTKSIIVDYDRGLKVAPWVIAAKNVIDVPRVTFLHGQLRKLTYLPVIADHILVWHDTQRAFIYASNANPEFKVHVVGVHWWDVAESAPPKSPERARVLFASSGPGSVEEKREIARRVCAVVLRAGSQPVVRPHPLESLGSYDGLDCEIEIPGCISASESLNAADVLITRRSTMADEAAAVGKHVVILEDVRAGDTARLPGQSVVRTEMEIEGLLSDMLAPTQNARTRQPIDKVTMGADACAAAVDVILTQVAQDQSRSLQVGKESRG